MIYYILLAISILFILAGLYMIFEGMEIAMWIIAFGTIGLILTIMFLSPSEVIKVVQEDPYYVKVIKWMLPFV